MGTCSVCDKDFEDKYFDAEQNKCILHCEKNAWYSLDENNKKIWDDDKVKLFWKYIQNDLDKKYDTHMTDSDLIEKKYILSNVIFPKFQDEVEYFSPAGNENEMGTNFYSYDVFKHPNEQPMPEVNTFFTKLIVSFDSCIFLDNANFKKYNFEHPILFNNCIFESEVELNKVYINRVSFLACTMQNLNCQDIIFEQKVKIQNCIVNGKANFYNTKFKELADFYRTKFNEVVFERADFEDFVDFASTTFENKVSFEDTTFEAGAAFVKCNFNKETVFTYTSFEDKTFFNEAKFLNKINLETATFYKDVDFLKIKTEVANRETARKIKDSFEKQNNIIEANKFYALEMKEREKELAKDIKSGKNIVDWLIFKAHAISSNHSQDPVSPILWILNIALFYLMSISTFYHNNALAFISALFMISFLFSRTTLLKIMLLANFLIFYFLSYINLDYLTDKINPFSIMTSKDTMTFGLLMFKIIIAYLIYQFIVSVRQNTRRK